MFQSYNDIVKALRSDCWQTLAPTRRKVVYAAADAIDELQQCADEWYKEACDYKSLVPRWIPVTERLPEDRRDVLVYAGVMFPYITVGYYDGLWKFSFNDEEIAGSADYWMPLPEPPKEEI